MKSCLKMQVGKSECVFFDKTAYSSGFFTFYNDNLRGFQIKNGSAHNNAVFQTQFSRTFQPMVSLS